MVTLDAIKFEAGKPRREHILAQFGPQAAANIFPCIARNDLVRGLSWQMRCKGIGHERGNFRVSGSFGPVQASHRGMPHTHARCPRRAGRATQNIGCIQETPARQDGGQCRKWRHHAARDRTRLAAAASASNPRASKLPLGQVWKKPSPGQHWRITIIPKQAMRYPFKTLEATLEANEQLRS